MTRRLARTLLAAGGVVVSLLTGCSDQYQLAPVSGKLTLDGKPVEGAVVIFSPIDAPEETGRPAGEPGRESVGTVGADGTFTLAQRDGPAGALTGPNQVIFEAPPTRRQTVPAGERDAWTPEQLKQMEAEFAAQPIYPALPPGLEISPNRVSVQPGENSFELVLQKAAGG